ncbi:MAG: hypothetical protein CMJ49_10725 [Planctomycetaceae bacterium]|nr:hypothetical protein [Planctomycetaceae bacterium]
MNTGGVKWRDTGWTTAIGLMLMTWCGCSGPGRVDVDGGSLPSRFEIELRALQADQRQVYYVLESDGMLSYGGGREAGMRAAEPVGHLTDEQRLELWQIIVDYKLLEAEGSFMAASARAQYDVRLRAGSHRHHFNTVDDRVPGLAELDMAMFAMQAKMRFGGGDARTAVGRRRAAQTVGGAGRGNLMGRDLD